MPSIFRRGRRTLRRLAGCEWLEGRQLLAADLVISEFLAANNSGLKDAYGETSDWIEIHNRGDEPADLAAYYLTDDASDLGKWRFPSSSTLAPGDYLTVFASGRDTVDAEANLHTNFRLGRDGEYVALTDARQQVVSSYGPGGDDYPAQLPDTSYGVFVTSERNDFVTPTSEARWWIPAEATLDSSWFAPAFAPSDDWQTGLAAGGFDGYADQGVPVSGGTAILQLDFGDDDSGESGTENTEPGWTNITLSDNGSSVNGITVTIEPVGGISLQDRDRTAPVDNPPSLTVDQLFDDFIYASSQSDDTGLEVSLVGLVPRQEYEVTLWSYDTGSVNSRISTWSEVSGPEPVEIESTYVFDGTIPPTSDLDYTMSAKLTASDTGELRIRGLRNGGTSFGVFLNALQLVVPSIESAVEHDLGASMADQGSSAYLRAAFEVPADLGFDALTLQMQYDSGFVAYLNGVEVARRGAPGTPGTPLGFAAAATSERTVTEALITESFDLTPFLPQLGNGPNLLAIHGLNSAATDQDFLLRPSLYATRIGPLQTRYFATPTPGAENSGTSFVAIVEDTAFSVDRGFYLEPQMVEVTSPTPGASLIYTLDGSLPSDGNGIRVDPPGPDQSPQVTIPIGTTTYLRALAVKDGYLPTNVDTQTYLFLDDVIQQSITPEEGDPRYPATWQSQQYPADYEMDPEVVAAWDDGNPENDDFGIREALKSIPTMSFVMDHDDLWNASSGIYPRAQSQGTFWRRPGSVEYFDPTTGEEFQVNAGIQMHGGASRDNERTKKHSFRILFKGEFDGPSELNFPLFKDSELGQFNTVVLKSFFTDGFPTRTNIGRYSPLDSQYLRDTWMRDVRLNMGGLEAHSEYVHLYINGLYWGLYSPVERPDDAFLAAYLGGEREDYDIIKDFNELYRGERDAWNEMFAIANGGLQTAEAYQRIQGNDPDGTRNPDLPVYLDVDDLIDYMILHLYAGAEDWPHHNWYAGRARTGETTGFRFFTWDQEIVLDGRYRDRTNVSDAFTPARLYARLRQNEDFQIRFADRVYQHLFHEGALTTDNARAAWMRRANQIEAAIIAESARWGDAREGERQRIDNGGPLVEIPTMTVDLWRIERDNVRDNYFPQSHELALARFQADGLFPETMPPLFSQRGGFVTSTTDLALSGPGQLYYTLDGSDPRDLGGAIRPAAILYDGPFRLPADATVTVRALDGDQWSALDRARFEVDKLPAEAGNFRISEIHYRPADNEDAEFVEWVNLGDLPLSLSGVKVSGGIEFDFANSTIASLAPGERLVLVRDVAAFKATYPQAVSVAGQYDGALSNAGETLFVHGPAHSIIQAVTYSDDPALGWPAAPDGGGPSLQAIDPRIDCAERNCNWRPSAVPGGTPGQTEYPVGDANLDRVFDSADLVLVFQAGKYENLAPGDATWAEGDWDGDGEFSSSDLVFAFQQGTYVAAARPRDRLARPELAVRAAVMQTAMGLVGVHSRSTREVVFSEMNTDVKLSVSDLDAIFGRDEFEDSGKFRPFLA